MVEAAGGEVYRDEYFVDAKRGTAGLKAQNRELDKSEKLLNRGASAAGRFERATGRAGRGAFAGRGGAGAARGLAGIAGGGFGGPAGRLAGLAGGALGGAALAGLVGAGAGLAVGAVGVGIGKAAFGAEAFAAEGKPLEAKFTEAATKQWERNLRGGFFGRLGMNIPGLSHIARGIAETRFGYEADNATREEQVQYLAEVRLADKERIRENKEIEQDIRDAMGIRRNDVSRREYTGGSSWGP